MSKDRMDRMSIEELAETVGKTRRTIRFYVQKGFLSKPVGLGRSAFYTSAHLEQLKKLIAEQGTGSGLSIREIKDNIAAPVETSGETAKKGARLLRRKVLPGVFVVFDETKAGRIIDDTDFVKVGAAIKQALGLKKARRGK